MSEDEPTDDNNHDQSDTRFCWTGDEVPDEYVEVLKSRMDQAGLDPDMKPPIRFLREHGLSGVRQYAARQGKTTDDVLIEELGFKPRNRKPLPGEHTETNRLLRAWLHFEEEKGGRYADSTLQDMWTHIRRIQEISVETFGHANLLRMAQAPRGESSRLLIELIAALREELETEGAVYNYTTTLVTAFDHFEFRGIIDDHIADEAIVRMGLEYKRESPDYIIKPAQIYELFQACETLEERVIVILLAGCGLRPDDITSVERDRLHLDLKEPKIAFDDSRKTRPATVPIMIGVGHIEAWIEQLEDEHEDWNGKLFPSGRSADGSRSTSYIRDRLTDIVNRAEVEMPDGRQPTPKDIRRYWYSEFVTARRLYMRQIVGEAAATQGSDSADIAEQHYLHDRQQRDHFREFASAHFRAAFPEEIVWDRETVEAQRDVDRTTGLDEFFTMTIGGVGITILSRRLERELRAIADGRIIPSSGRAARGAVSYIAFVLSLGMMFAAGGVGLEPSSMSVTASPPDIAGLSIGLLVGTARVLTKASV